MVQKAGKITVYRPAVYARLSDEDNRAGVSLSIEHQLEILRKYVKDSGWGEPKVFYDDNRTGTNFEREGFQKMYAEAQSGNINVLVIKDTSRFGRNWVQSGVYFEKIEEMGVRFISIQESIDTADPKCPALKMLPFYFIFNEWHSQTTSEKIRTVNRHMAEQGKHRSPYAPYGYQKDPNDKHKLIIDPYSSQVVKRIYEMRLQKYSYGAITTVLNNEGISPPNVYALETNGKTNYKKGCGKWTKTTFSKLFKNPVYCGDTANCKTRVVSYKNSKQVNVPPEEWVIVRDTHEAIVSRDDWQKCYDMIKSLDRVRRPKESGDMLPLSGLVKCQDCGYTMRYNHATYKLKSGEKRKTRYFKCGLHAVTGTLSCSSHYISEKDLTKIVCADIRKVAGEIVCDEQAARERFYQAKEKMNNGLLNTDKKVLQKINKRLSELDKLIQSAFENSVLGGSSVVIFEKLAKNYESEKRTLTEKANQLSESIEKQSKSENDVEMFIKLMKEYVNITDLDRATAVELIDNIVVSEKTDKPREIVIYYNFIGNV